MNRRRFIKSGALLIPAFDIFIPRFAEASRRRSMMVKRGGGGGGGVDSPDDVSGLQLWLKADAITGLSDGDPVATWADSSGNGRDATQATSGNRPTYETAELNSLPVVRFAASSSHHLDLPNFLTGFTSGEIFIVCKVNNDPSSSAPPQSGLWWFGSSGETTHIPYSNGDWYDSFGSTARKQISDPAPALTTWRLYNVSSSSGDWTARLDGTQIHNTASNTVGWITTPAIGNANDTAYHDGDIAEVVLYNAVLSSGDRDSLETYFDSKYNLSF